MVMLKRELQKCNDDKSQAPCFGVASTSERGAGLCTPNNGLLLDIPTIRSQMCRLRKHNL